MALWQWKHVLDQEIFLSLSCFFTYLDERGRLSLSDFVRTTMETLERDRLKRDACKLSQCRKMNFGTEMYNNGM